ncbi:VTT domain-containing protein [Dechloromonas denitrificans]|uniref:VTT domain-containing protein n=1 Tax=Dechloromonas denitrificans TaxID=281362 RepID=UPI001CF80A78|nr:VTT domain-containing protein [Dechloromonas denitrificans]UCV02654.1 VTT domain-containing protein [Dechloromonas denitrificans]
MDLSQISESLQRDAVWVVFLNVLLQQAGLPVPAVPTLLLAGSLAASPSQLANILAAAIVASVLADWMWYLAGRAFGYRVLAGLCRLSINPGSCVNQTEARFVRWGLGSLVVAKFIPGFSTVAPPIAGALRMGLLGFLLAAAAGAALWAGAALAAGWLLRQEVHSLVGVLDRQSGGALLVLLGIVAIWLGWKLWQKYRFRKLAAVPHITPDELLAAQAAQRPLLLLDLRGPAMVAESGAIAGATLAEHDRLLDAVGDWPKDQLIVTLCACPEDAGAIQAARRLLDADYQTVRPLKGGYEAWLATANVNP